MNTPKTLLVSLCLIIATISSLSAQAIGDKFKVWHLYYQVTSLSPNEVAVVPQNTDYPYWDRYRNQKPTGEISIPTTIRYNETRYYVTSIGVSAFSHCTGLTSVSIPNSIKDIERYAFNECTRLSNITIPNSVTNIGKEAFRHCIGLTNVTIPNSVTNIGEATFRSCTGLTNIHVDTQNPNYADIEGVLFNKDKTILIAYPSAKADTYIAPNSVTNIGNYAFEDCTELTNIAIPNSVTNIGSSAFSGCTGLTSIIIPNSVTKIENFAFGECIGLLSITSEIADLSQLTMGSYIFSYIDKNNCILYVPQGKVADYQAAEQWKEFAKIREIGSSLEVGDRIKVGNLYYQVSSLSPHEVAVVPQSIFYPHWNESARPTGEITIPTTITYDKKTYSVTNIGNRAFEDCTGLTNVTIPNSVKNIGESVFKGCTGLTSMNIPSSITNIGQGAFFKCTGLTSITIPNSVKSIGDSGFRECTGLTIINIPNSITELGGWVFKRCTALKAIHVDVQNPNYTDIEGVLFNKDKTTLIAYPNAKATSYIIPNSVTNIGDGAFIGCAGLTNVIIPNSVTNIEGWAFWDCTGLTNITIPNSVRKIDNWTFSGCIGLTNVTIPNSVTNIGSSAFSGCRGLTSITIPNSVKKIGNFTFSNCRGLTSITSEIADLSQLTMGSYIFSYIDKSNCFLYVPQGKVADYQVAEQWKEFTNIKEIARSGISQVDAERYIDLSPNPARDKVTISIAPALIGQVSSLTLLDSNGKALQKQAITDSETIIDLTRYTSGIYFVQIDNVVKKLIIK